MATPPAYKTRFFEGLSTVELLLWAALAVWQICVRVPTFAVDYDHVIQIAAGLNFVRGHGFGNFVVDARDLSVATPQHLSLWPPGFSLIFLVFYALFRNPFTAVLVADLGGTLALLAGGMLWCSRLRDAFPTRGRLLFAVVLAGIGFPEYYFANTWALAITMIGVGLLIPPPGRPEISARTLVVAGILFGALPGLRYAYALVSPAPLLVFLWEAKSDRTAWRRMALFFAGWAVFILPFAWWKICYVHNIVPSHFSARGSLLANAKNLRWTYPFGFDTFIGYRFTRKFRSYIYPTSAHFHKGLYGVRHLVGAGVIAAALLGARLSLRSAADDDRVRAQRRFFRLALVISAATAAVLMGLTVAQQAKPVSGPYSSGHSMWVEPARYWVLIEVFLLAGAVLAFSRTPQRKIERAAAWFVTACLTASLGFWIYAVPLEFQGRHEWTWTGPIAGYYQGGRGLIRYLGDHQRTDVPNVVVSFGHPRVETYQRVAEVNIDGWASAHADNERPPATSVPINVVAVLESDSEDASRAAFERTCGRLGAVPEGVGDLSACNGLLRP